MDECNLEDLFQLHHGITPSTATKIEHCYINRIAVSGKTCKHTGILPCLMTKDSDHRAIYTDIDATQLFNSKPSLFAQMAQRKLTVGNQISCDSYIQWGTKQAVEHNIEGRCDTLLNALKANGDKLTQAQTRLRNATDKQFEEICKGAHNQC